MKNKKTIKYADLWGIREEKYDWLEKNDIKSTDWKALAPSNPYYFFVFKKGRGQKQYQSFWKITEIFPVNSVGVVTGRDDFVIDENRQSLEVKIRNFVESRDNDEFIKNAYNLKDKPASNWFVKNAQEKLKKDENWEKCFTKILYRPFDERWIFYHPSLVERVRSDVMKHMMNLNLGLIARRQIPSNHPANYFFVSDKIIADGLIRSDNKGSETIFPLYLYEDYGQKNLFGSNSGKHPHANISDLIWEQLSRSDLSHALPENIFNYIYGILYSNTYRCKYNEFLKIDFPRIPFTKNYKLFQRIADLGKKLVDLHLLKSPVLDNPVIKFKGQGDNRVEKVDYLSLRINDLVGGDVWINESQHFDGVNGFLWNYYIGGYQVLYKWLKDRKRRVLSTEDIKNYLQVATAIHYTILIQKEIDKLYPEVEKSLIR